MMILSLSLSLCHQTLYYYYYYYYFKTLPCKKNHPNKKMKSKYPKNNKSQSKQQLNNNNKCKVSINNKGLKKLSMGHPKRDIFGIPCTW
jgi:hypothetical protein